MIYLPSKAPGDVADYNLSMTQFIPAGVSIDTVAVEVDAAGNSESPITLTAIDVSFQPVEEGDAESQAILFWLTGGTAGVRYRGRIMVSDSQSADPDREYVRRFEVEVDDL